MKEIDLLIIGGGSAGLAAAIEAYDQGVQNLLLLEAEPFLGGILLQCIHNGFGLMEFQEQLAGPEYAQRFVDAFMARNIPYHVDSLVLDITGNKVVHYSNKIEGDVYVQCKAIIQATGAGERSRGAISIPGDRPKGVITAGLAQRYLNIDGYLVGKRVFILGSGDIGLIMARRMTLEGAKVLGVAELMPYSNGLNRNIVQCLHDFNIPLYLSHTVVDIIGKEELEKVVIAKVDDKLQPIPGTEQTFEVDALLLSVGLIPSNQLLEKIAIPTYQKTKGAMVTQNMETMKEGIFSCGNSLHIHDLVDFVSKEGRKAGKAAAKYLHHDWKEKSGLIDTKPLKGIRYVLPNWIDLSNLCEDKVELNYRVDKPYGKVRILVKVKEEVLYNRLYLHQIPSEMGSIFLTKDQLLPLANETISIEVKEEA